MLPCEKNHTSFFEKLQSSERFESRGDHGKQPKLGITLTYRDSFDFDSYWRRKEPFKLSDDPPGD